MTDENRPGGEQKENGEPQSQTTSPKQVITTGAIVFGIILVVWLLALFVTLNAGCWKPGSMAELGDAFGTINALFSGMALVGVVIGLFYQSREFAAQVNEMKAQTKHFEQDVQNLREQNEQMKIEFIQSQIETHMRAIPIFEVIGGGRMSKPVRPSLENMGQTVYNVRILTGTQTPMKVFGNGRCLGRGRAITFEMNPQPEKGAHQMIVIVEFITSLGWRMSQKLHLSYRTLETNGDVGSFTGGTDVNEVLDDVTARVTNRLPIWRPQKSNSLPSDQDK